MRFREQVRERLLEISPETLAYNGQEFWLIQSVYEYVEYYAMERQLMNTAIALPLARGLHDGSYRKSAVTRGGVACKPPYVIHCLMVCRMLVDLHVPLPKEEEDVLLAAALCHDMIEDIPFPEKGMELTTRFGLDPRVYETVKLVSKRKDFTPEEEQAHFDAIARHKLALLVKLSDRSHNVEDLYNMSAWKVQEYIGETRRYIRPICVYGLEHYPELERVFEIMLDKLDSLCRASEILVERCEAREKELQTRLEALRKENEALRRTYAALWEGREEEDGQ